MNSIIITVGIGISLLIVGFAGGYLISGQTPTDEYDELSRICERYEGNV